VRIKTLIKIILSIFPVVLSLPSILYLSDNTLVLFPNPRYVNQIESFTSENSSIENFSFDSRSITFSYILRETPDGETTSYGSIVIWLNRDNTFLDLSAYDYLSIEIENATPANVVIFIKTFEKGVSNPERKEAHTLRHNEYALLFAKGVSRYDIRITDFITQDWWFEMMNVPVEKRFEETYTKASALDFQFIHRGRNRPEEKEEVFTATRIAFRKSYPIIFILLNIAAALYSICLASVVFSKKKKIIGLIRRFKTPPIKEIQYKRLELENYSDHELSRIMTYLEEHYNNPKISSSLISQETGIPRSHIAELVKNRYDCTCKQLINRIRITEAKRLLKATDRRIIEVALEVGYMDISTFNRCFKQIEGISPRQYRAG
jgi:AraC-like DNA-binding protein